jgi:tripartite-type tricarboxylate transporter receptor subunit TctC
MERPQTLSPSQALAQAQTGAIRIIATINDGRSKYFPDVPTMAEQGFAEAQVTPWFGIVVPAGTPQPIVKSNQQGAGNRPCGAGGAREA